MNFSWLHQILILFSQNQGLCWARIFFSVYWNYSWMDLKLIWYWEMNTMWIVLMQFYWLYVTHLAILEECVWSIYHFYVFISFSNWHNTHMRNKNRYSVYNRYCFSPTYVSYLVRLSVCVGRVYYSLCIGIMVGIDILCLMRMTFSQPMSLIYSDWGSVLGAYIFLCVLELWLNWPKAYIILTYI